MEDTPERCDDAQWWSRLPDLYPVPTGTPDAALFRFDVSVGRNYRLVSDHLRREVYIEDPSACQHKSRQAIVDIDIRCL